MKHQQKTHKKKKKHQRVVRSFVFLASACLLIVGAYFLITSRGGFIDSQVQALITGPDQIEGGQTEQFEVVIKNTSNLPIELGKVRVGLVGPLKFSDDNTQKKSFEEGTQVEPGEEFRESVSITSIQSEEKASIEISAPYYPQDRKAGFVAKDSHNIVIGSLDAEVDFQMPELAFVGEQVTGTITITPHTSFEKDDLYVRVTTAGDLNVVNATPQFADQERCVGRLTGFSPA